MDIPKLTLRPEEIETQVGYIKQFSVNETFRLHTHDFYEFFYICKGKSIHEINGTNQLLVQGALVFIRPDDVHQFDFFNHYDMHIISCGVSVSLMEDAFHYLGIDHTLFTSPALPPCIILEGTDYLRMEQKLDQIDKKNPGSERQTYFRSLLPELLYLFLSDKQAANPPLPIWFSNLLTAMNEPQNFIAGLDAMLHLANISQEHLTREFRKRLHMTPTQYINSKRINYAADLLLQHKYEILDVCFMSGFHNLTYFYKIFQKHYNCTPKDFQKKYS